MESVCKKLLCRFLIAVIAIGCAYYGFVQIWNKNILETHDVSKYLDNSYLEYTGGAEAKRFFDKYVCAVEYKNIAFHYKNSGQKIGLYNYWTVFVLDVYYDPNAFFDITNKLLLDTDLKELPDESNVGFLEYLIISSQPLYLNNYAVFYIDIKHHTVRYGFVYDCPHKPGESTDVRSIIERSIKLPWNNSEDHMAFNYCEQ